MVAQTFWLLQQGEHIGHSPPLEGRPAGRPFCHRGHHQLGRAPRAPTVRKFLTFAEGFLVAGFALTLAYEFGRSASSFASIFKAV